MIQSTSRSISFFFNSALVCQSAEPCQRRLSSRRGSTATLHLTVSKQPKGQQVLPQSEREIGAGIIGAAQLAGYRNGPVYIRHAQHVPMSVEAVRDCMPVFFELLKAETDANVRIVLGHFIFAFIHPFIDGNGRTARFLMNLMIAAAGQPWTVIPVEHRKRYMAALEAASVQEDIEPFAQFLADVMGSAPKYLHNK